MKLQGGNKAAHLLGAADSSAEVRLLGFKECSWD